MRWDYALYGLLSVSMITLSVTLIVLSERDWRGELGVDELLQVAGGIDKQLPGIDEKLQDALEWLPIINGTLGELDMTLEELLALLRKLVPGKPNGLYF